MKDLAADVRGSTASEYTLIATLIGLAIAGGLTDVNAMIAQAPSLQ